MKIKYFLLSATTFIATLSIGAPAVAQEYPMIGTIKTFAFNFCPRGWAEADGTLQAITSNTSLFSLYGTYYGGDGRTTFGLPDLRGRIVSGKGKGPGLTDRRIGQRMGAEKAVIKTANLAKHTHRGAIQTSDQAPNDKEARGAAFADQTKDFYHDGVSAAKRYMDLGTVIVEATGADAPAAFDITQPVVVLKQCVAMTGVYPSRS